MVRKIGVLAVAVLSLAGTACSKETTPATDGGGTETQTQEPTGESTATSTPSIVISSGTETVSIGGGEIPADFPASFPLPDDATAAFSSSGGGSFVIWFSSAMSSGDLNGFFDSGLSANGWTIDGQFDFSDPNGTYRMYSISGNGYTGGVYTGQGAPGSESFEGDFAFFVVLSPA